MTGWARPSSTGNYTQKAKKVAHREYTRADIKELARAFQSHALSNIGYPQLARYSSSSVSFTIGELTPIAPRDMFFSSCRAVHHQLSSVAQSYAQVQRFLAEGSHRALSEL